LYCPDLKNNHLKGNRLKQLSTQPQTVPKQKQARVAPRPLEIGILLNDQPSGDHA
jgi:hypothetical protein